MDKKLNHKFKHKLNRIGLEKLLQEVLIKKNIIKRLPALIEDYKKEINKFISELE